MTELAQRWGLILSLFLTSTVSGEAYAYTNRAAFMAISVVAIIASVTLLVLEAAGKAARDAEREEDAREEDAREDEDEEEDGDEDEERPLRALESLWVATRAYKQYVEIGHSEASAADRSGIREAIAFAAKTISRESERSDLEGRG